MVTCGGAMSGYCSIGETDIDTAPASTISSEMTAERIGRSMKKWVNIAAALLLGRLGRLLRRLGRFAARSGGASGCNLDRLAGYDFQRAVGDHLVAGFQPIHD